MSSSAVLSQGPSFQKDINSISQSEGWGEWTMPAEMAAYSAACSDLDAAQDRLSSMIEALWNYADRLRRDPKAAGYVPDGLPSPQAIRDAYLKVEAARGALDRCRLALSPEQLKPLRPANEVGKPRHNIDDNGSH